MTAEAVDELDLKVGDEAVCVVKATNVIVEIPSSQGVARVNRRRSPSLAVLAIVLAACSSGGGAVAASARRRPRRPTVVVGGPASARAGRADDLRRGSLKGALEQAKAAYEAANPGTTLTISTDSSSALETQIEQGAPADVFLSADTTNPQKLVDAGLDRRRRRSTSPATC